MQGCSNNSNGGSAMRKGPWMAEEDEILLEYVRKHGPRDWSSIRSKGLLPRTGKSCRLRWVNKLKPDLKTGCKFSQEEERIVIDLQAKFGNKWARIATYLPGRTDNDVKNFWSTRQKRMARQNNNNSHGHTSSSRSKKNHLQLATSSSFAPQPPAFEVKCLDIVPYEESSSCNFDCSQNYYVEDRDFRVENFDQSQTSLQSQENMNGPILEPSLVWEHYPHPTSDFLVDFGAFDLTFPEPFNCVPYVDFGVGNSKIGSVKMEDDSGIFLDDFPVEMFDELEKSMQQPTSSAAAAAAW